MSTTPSKADERKLARVFDGLTAATDYALEGDEDGGDMTLALAVATELVKIASWEDFLAAYKKAKEGL